MKRLLVALLLALGGCNDCRRTLHLQLDFNGDAAQATELLIFLGPPNLLNQGQHTFKKRAGSTVETLDVKLAAQYVGPPFHVSVSASTATSPLIADATVEVPTNDTSCPLHHIALNGSGNPGGGDMSPSCGGDAGACGGAGICAGSCVSGTCSYPATACNACIHGAERSGSCASGTCSPTGAPQQCVDGLCADEHCGTIVYGRATVAAGNGFTCALVSDAGVAPRALCWGSNAGGVLGVDPSARGRSYIPLPVAGTSGMGSIAAGDDFACGLSGGSVLCWGSNRYGQLGNGGSDGNAHPTPMPVIGLPSGKPSVVAGGQHACAIINSAIYCWGRNSHGELGALPAQTGTPMQVLVGGPTITSVALGQHHLCFNEMAQDGTFDTRCLGASNLGQVGVSDGADHATPVTIASLNAELTLVAGGDTTCAGVLSSRGDLRCWGGNGHGQLGGGGTVGAFSATPVSVCGGSCNFLNDFAVGSDFTCAATDEGVRCWGDGAGERLGFVSGDLPAPGMPALGPIGPTSFYFLAAGYDQACAAVASDAFKVVLRCWGNNAGAQLGLPATVTTSVPAAPHWGD